MSPSLLMVTAPRLFRAVEGMGDRDTLVNGVKVTRAQLRKAAEILRDRPQPVCNGIRDDMPGFIDRDTQAGKSLRLQVGILPSSVYLIDSLGRARLSAAVPESQEERN